MRYGKHSVGPFEEMLLRAAAVPASGLALREAIERQAGRKVRLDALYHSLSRLRSKGYIARNGLRPRNYWATEAGLAALEEVRQSRESVSTTDTEAR